MQSLSDVHEYPVTGATAAALEHYTRALAEFRTYRADPLASVELALAEAPGFVMARCLKAYLGLLATDAAGFRLAKQELLVLPEHGFSAREAGHRAAVAALSAGSWSEGLRHLERVLADNPRDVLALQVAHLANFYIGDARNLRDTAGRVLGAWDARAPGYHAVLGMHAFGLEECGDYARAERQGRRAVELEPRDVWAMHAVAHVYEMQGRIEEGIVWYQTRERDWADDNFFAVHNHWHLALYHLDRGELDRVLAIYDQRIRGTRSSVVLDLIDASAMLLRLELRGVDVRSRFEEVADAWAPLAADGSYAFNDVHAAIAFLGADRRAMLDVVVQSLAHVSAEGTGSNRAMAQEVAVPLVRGLTALSDGAPQRALEELLRVRPVLSRFGGSHAQRDLFDQALAVAAARAKQRGLLEALVREREELRPGHPVARWLAGLGSAKAGDAAPSSRRASHASALRP